MTKSNYRARIRSLRHVLTVATWALVLVSGGLIIFIGSWQHFTMRITIASVICALVILVLAYALRIAFRNLPEAERMATKFDDDAPANPRDDAK